MSTLSVTTLTGLSTSPTPTKIEVASGHTLQAPGHVIQTVSETIDTQLAGSIGSAGTYIDTGVTASITPTSANNKILVSFVFGGAGSNASGDLLFRLMRGSSNIAQGASGSTYISTAAIRSLNAEVSCTPCFIHLDSPAATSATTYKVQGSLTGSGTLAINRRQADTVFATASSITLMEIAQ